jgi:2'-5' RNA ligase
MKELPSSGELQPLLDAYPSVEDRRARSDVMFALPKLSPLIDEFRKQYTADGRAGIPPHISLLNPFYAVDEMTPAIKERIAKVAATVPPFEAQISGFGRFDNRILYFTVSAKEEIGALIERFREEFSEIGSYWDRYSTITPHITIAESQDPTVLDTIEARVQEAISINLSLGEVTLMQRVKPSPAPWDVQGQWPLPSRE